MVPAFSPHAQMGVRRAVIAIGLFAAWLAPAASAAPGDIARLPGAAGCITDDGTAGACQDGTSVSLRA